MLIGIHVNHLLCVCHQHFPIEVTKICLYWNQKAIKFINDDTGKIYYGEVHCAKRKKYCQEREICWKLIVRVCKKEKTKKRR